MNGLSALAVLPFPEGQNSFSGITSVTCKVTKKVTRPAWRRSVTADSSFVISYELTMNCRRSKLHLCLLGLILLACYKQTEILAHASPPAPPQRSMSEVLKNVERKYNRLKTVRMRFQQIYRQGDRIIREEEGILYLRKPGKMRWEYERPEPKLFLTDGRRLILYLPNENRMTETAVKESGDLRTPLRFLLGNMRFAEEFRRIETSTDFEPLEDGNLVLKAFSERLENRLEWVLFEINPEHQIRRLVLQEPGDIQQEFRFEGEESNLPLSEQLFRFLPPEGTEVIRQ